MKSFPRVYHKLMAEPWLVMPAVHASLRAVVDRHATGLADLFQQDDEDQCDKPSVEDGVGIVPLTGIISKDISDMEKSCGGVDLRDFMEHIIGMQDDPAVEAVVIDIESPGGTVSGVPEAADMVAQVAKEKPVIAYTDGLMASAAYWIGSGATLLYASPSALVGSIGVYSAYLDETRAYEAEGVKVELIKAEGSPLKGAGVPGTALTADQRAELQAQADHLYAMFSNFVRAHRVGVVPSAMNGGTHFANKALGVGLVDKLSTLEGAIYDARRYAAARRSIAKR